ncbi:hypothetical protein H4R24_003448 [Coemansia sp. RSA 988]|nr:hypothetical protein H4R24_003448 [Coemansia sp. RSA 988]
MSNVDQATGNVKETVGGLMGNDQNKEDGHSQCAHANCEREVLDNKDQCQEQADKGKGGAAAVADNADKE